MKKLNSYLAVLLIICVFILAIISSFAIKIIPMLKIIFMFINYLDLQIINTNKVLNWTYEGVSNYFNHQIIYTENIKNYKFDNKQYIKCLMPHGFVSLSLLCIRNNNHFTNDILVTSNQLYNSPFISLFRNNLNMIPAEFNIMNQHLQSNKNLVIYPGGMREKFECSHREEVIVINKRKGLFKLALMNGTTMLPVYTFGVSEIYEKSNYEFKLKNGVGLSWYYGLYNTPFPKKVNFLTVVGSPIFVKKKINITDNDINNLRNRYKIIIKKLFHKWKSFYNPSWYNKKLIFK
jgi:hypothetical protein